MKRRKMLKGGRPNEAHFQWSHCPPTMKSARIRSADQETSQSKNSLLLLLRQNLFSNPQPTPLVRFLDPFCATSLISVKAKPKGQINTTINGKYYELMLENAGTDNRNLWVQYLSTTTVCVNLIISKRAAVSVQMCEL